MKSFTTILMVSALVGCATRTEVIVDYHPESISLPESALGLAGTAFRQVKVVDGRIDRFTNEPLSDPKVLLNKRDAHQRMLASVFATDRPLSEYVQRSFEEALLQASVTTSSSAPLELLIKIEQLSDPRISRSLLQTDYFVEMGITASLINSTTGKVTWSELFIGRAKIDLSGTFNMGPYYARTLPSTVAAVVKQCLASTSFVRAARMTAPS